MDFFEMEIFDGGCPLCDSDEVCELDRWPCGILDKFGLPPSEAGRVIVRRYVCNACGKQFHTGELDGDERLVD